MRRRAEERLRVAQFVALAGVLCLMGCAAVRFTPEVPKADTQTKLENERVEYELKVAGPEVAAPSLTASLSQLKTANVIEETRYTQTMERRGWVFQPEFFALPFAPIQTAGCLVGAGGLVAGAVATYPVRWGGGLAAAGACALTGGLLYSGQVVVGSVSMATFLLLNPILIKYPIAVVTIGVEYVALCIPAAIDGFFSSARSPKPFLETIMLLPNLDVLTFGNILYRHRPGIPWSQSPYTPYYECTQGEYWNNLGSKWRKGFNDTAEFIGDTEWVSKTFFKGSAADCWKFAWDFEEHNRFWGLTASKGASAVETCWKEAWHYKGRYALLPVGPSGEWYKVRDVEDVSKRTRVPKDKKEERSAAEIAQLTGEVRAKREGAPSVLLGPAGNTAVVNLEGVAKRFCHDDELTVTLKALPKGEPPGRAVTKECLVQVAQLRPPGEPHVEWLSPKEVKTGPGDAGRNVIKEKQFPLSVRLVADTADAEISSWQIKWYGKVIGGDFGVKGRTVVASPTAPVEFKQANEPTALEVEVTDSKDRKATVSATFVYSPSP